MSVKYRFIRDFRVIGNITLSKFDRKSSNDGLEDGFNTPQWITNISIGNDKVSSWIGFMVTYRWQSTYYWQSFLVNGDVQAYHTVDAQISCALNKMRLKIGGTNILNQYYHSFLGGPSVGGFYYTSVSFNL